MDAVIDIGEMVRDLDQAGARLLGFVHDIGSGLRDIWD
jgi:hypothetical protein